MSHKYWVIGFGDYVEIREALKQPVKQETTIKRGTVKRSVYIDEVYIDRYGNHQRKMKHINEPVEIHSVVYTGGKVLCSLPMEKFKKIAGAEVEMNQLRPVLASDIDKIFNWKQGAANG